MISNQPTAVRPAVLERAVQLSEERMKITNRCFGLSLALSMLAAVSMITPTLAQDGSLADQARMARKE